MEHVVNIAVHNRLTLVCTSSTIHSFRHRETTFGRMMIVDFLYSHWNSLVNAMRTRILAEVLVMEGGGGGPYLFICNQFIE